MAYLNEDTIAAIGTAVGGAISMIRVSGPSAFGLLSRLTGHGPGELAAHRQLARAPLRDPQGTKLDDALYARFVGPESYTGEDVVELHIHGGAFLAARLMEVLRHHGARQALPGEFSFRAVRNGKMTLSQAQAVADLIASSNDGALGLALEKMSGTQNQLLGGIATSLRHLAVLGEAGIDFADQDIDEVGLPQLRLRLDQLIDRLEQLRGSYDRGFRLQEGVGVAFVGLPNAGKSSFFNALLGEDRSIVSELAGTTRDVVREKITLRGSRTTLTLRLEDTAGLRSAEHPVEKLGIARSLKAAQAADLILLIVSPDDTPAEVTQSLASIGNPVQKTLGVLTKTDLCDASRLFQVRDRFRSLGIPVWVEVSSLTGAGIPQAIEAITSFCEKWIHRDPGEVLLTRLDHLQAVENALTHLARARSTTEIDLFAADLRQALHGLAPLIGETLPDDILGKIFSEFCIGK